MPIQSIHNIPFGTFNHFFTIVVFGHVDKCLNGNFHYICRRGSTRASNTILLICRCRSRRRRGGSFGRRGRHGRGTH